jgi:hypothetical protein
MAVSSLADGSFCRVHLIINTVRKENVKLDASSSHLSHLAAALATSFQLDFPEIPSFLSLLFRSDFCIRNSYVLRETMYRNTAAWNS